MSFFYKFPVETESSFLLHRIHRFQTGGIVLNRDQKIIKTSIIGIVANVFLAAFKAAIGLLSHSVAVILDAVNNLSDALSSLITIIGTKLAGKEPDKKHPLGYGRVEYLSATVISVIVLYAGITAFVESVKKILHPETPDYSPIALIIIAVAVAVKITLGLYVKKTGNEVDSDALVASGKDAMFDSVISASTLVAAIIYIASGISLEAWLGAIIAIVIIKSGFEMLRDTVSEILGERVDPEIARSVKETVASFPEVQGAYDLTIHNYGPDKLIGSVHIAVPDTMTAKEIDILERNIVQKVYLENRVGMTGISVYSVNTQDDHAGKMEKQVMSFFADDPNVLEVHAFYVDEAARTMKFDLVLSFDIKDRYAFCTDTARKMQELFPDYTIQITPDFDISD